ncbi:MAG: GNAT family N-acetyltransferase, partial [Candidatus Nanohaloarchaea archaeon]
MEFGFAEDYHILPNSAEMYREDDGAEIFVAEEDGEVLGSAVYRAKNGFGALEYVNVLDPHQGRDIADNLIDKVMEYAEESEAESVYSQATSMNGRVQHMLQKRGFEASGFSLGNAVSEVQDSPSGGFDVNLWKTDTEAEAYIPEELQGFTEAS